MTSSYSRAIPKRAGRSESAQSMLSVRQRALVANGNCVDDAALVLKFDSRPRDVYFLEVAPGARVQVKNWREAKSKYGDDKLYSSIAIRHLDYERDEGLTEVIEKFVNETRDAQYADPPMEKKTSLILPDVGENERLVEEGRSFFGSELVAKAYKCFGLIETTVTKSSSRFLPGKMNPGSGFNLVKGASLGKEQAIVLAPDFFACAINP